MPVKRTTISGGSISLVGVLDDDQPPVMITNFKLPQAWTVDGIIEHTVYNTPAESNCEEGLVKGFVVTPSCNFISVQMKSDFRSQAAMNGTGIINVYGLVASNNGTPLPPGCTRPKGSTKGNTFIEISQVVGSCGAVLNGNSVAVYPNPVKVAGRGIDAACGDNILEVNTDDSNKAVNMAEDTCAACNHKPGTLASHIDNYLASDNQCFARGKYTDWTADTKGESQ